MKYRKFVELFVWGLVLFFSPRNNPEFPKRDWFKGILFLPWLLMFSKPDFFKSKEVLGSFIYKYIFTHTYVHIYLYVKYTGTPQSVHRIPGLSGFIVPWNEGIERHIYFAVPLSAAGILSANTKTYLHFVSPLLCVLKLFYNICCSALNLTVCISSRILWGWSQWPDTILETESSFLCHSYLGWGFIFRIPAIPVGLATPIPGVLDLNPYWFFFPLPDQLPQDFLFFFARLTSIWTVFSLSSYGLRAWI